MLVLGMKANTLKTFKVRLQLPVCSSFIFLSNLKCSSYSSFTFFCLVYSHFCCSSFYNSKWDVLQQFYFLNTCCLCLGSALWCFVICHFIEGGFTKSPWCFSWFYCVLSEWSSWVMVLYKVLSNVCSFYYQPPSPSHQ